MLDERSACFRLRRRVSAPGTKSSLTLSAPRMDVKHYQSPGYVSAMPENAGFSGRRDFSAPFSEEDKAFGKGKCRRRTG